MWLTCSSCRIRCPPRQASGSATRYCNHAVFLVISPPRAYLGGVMFWRVMGLAVAAVLLAGCAGQRTGFDYAGVMQKVGPPKAGQARVVVFQEKAGALAATTCDVKLDGKLVGRLVMGAYVYADVPTGQHQLMGTETLFPSESKRDITTQSGRTYFFLARTSERHHALMGATMVGGLSGLLVGSVVTSGADSPGPVDFVALDEAAARTAMAELHLAE